MNKIELSKAVAERLGIQKKDAEAVVSETFQAIIDTLRSGEDVSISGFAKFESKDTPARQGRNPQTGEAVAIPAGKKIKVKVLKDLKEAVKQ